MDNIQKSVKQIIFIIIVIERISTNKCIKWIGAYAPFSMLGGADEIGQNSSKWSEYKYIHVVLTYLLHYERTQVNWTSSCIVKWIY